jgi:hypothetical protein
VKTLFSRLTNYVKRSASEACQWGRNTKPSWIWLALTCVIWLAFYSLPYDLPTRVHWAGTLFEFMGVVAVVISIDRARVSFGEPTVLRGALIRLGEFRFIFFHRPAYNLKAVGITTLSPIVSSASMTVIKGPQTTEQRVDQLEKEVNELKTNLGKLDEKVDQHIQELRAELEKEISARQNLDQSVSKNLKEHIIGDSAWEVAGISYVCLGLIMAHLSDEVASGLSWLFGLT